MVTGQAASVGIYEELERQGNLPSSMTFETGGILKIRIGFISSKNLIRYAFSGSRLSLPVRGIYGK